MNDDLNEQAESQTAILKYPTIRVLIADDHPVVRNGIAYSLSPFDDLVVIGQASTGEEAVALGRKLHPDVILMDLMRSFQRFRSSPSPVFARVIWWKSPW